MRAKLRWWREKEWREKREEEKEEGRKRWGEKEGGRGKDEEEEDIRRTAGGEFVKLTYRDSKFYNVYSTPLGKENLLLPWKRTLYKI